MKKLLIMLSMVGVATANLNLLHLINGVKIIKSEQQKEESIFKPLDWKEIKENINQMYSNFSLNKAYSDDEQEMLQQAKIKSLEYFDKFESKNSSYEDVVIEIKNEHEGFKKEYEENWDDGIGIWVSAAEADEWVGGPKGAWLEDWMGGYKGKWLGSSGTSWSQPPIKEWIEPLPENMPEEIRNGQPFSLEANEEGERTLLEKVNNINLLGQVCASVAVAAGLVGAAFWALAWAGGISIPWAVAASTVSATLGILSGVITFTTGLIANEIQQIKANGLKETQRAAAVVLTFFKSALLATLLTSAVVVTATSWAVPFVFGVIGLIMQITSWIYWVNPNILDSSF